MDEMKMINKIILASALGLFALTAEAVVVLGSTCSVGTSVNGIAITDVTGNLGGATECWGTFNGNDPGPSGGGFQVSGIQFDFVAKEEMGTPPVWEGADIGLVVSPDDGTATSGTWAYDPGKFAPPEFLVVLKAANDPGYAVWLFSGADAASFSGDWLVAWTNKNGQPRELSHLSIYASRVPVPPAVWLFGSGLLGLVGIARRKRV